MKSYRILLIASLLALNGFPALAEEAPAQACTGENCMERVGTPAEVCEGENCLRATIQECTGEDCAAIPEQSGRPEIETPAPN